MSKIEELKLTIESLPDDEFKELRQWFSEKDWQKWDKQIEDDTKSGKLDFLIEEANNEKKSSKLKEL